MLQTAHCSAVEEDQEAIHERWGRERCAMGVVRTQFRLARVKYAFIRAARWEE